MGRNNNNAGMHLCWYTNPYFRFDMADKHSEDESVIKVIRNIPVFEKKDYKSTSKPIKNEVLDNQQYKSKNDVKKQKVKIQKPKETENNELSRFSLFSTGKEEVIDPLYFGDYWNIPTNIMAIALKKKINISKVLDDIEMQLLNDIRINPNYKNAICNQSYILNNSIVALRMIADKLDCSINDLLDFNRNEYKRVAYSILDIVKEVPDYELKGYICNDSKNAVLSIPYFDKYLIDGDNCIIDEEDEEAYPFDMKLEIVRIHVNGKPFYYMQYGAELVYMREWFEYIPKQASIWGSSSGKIKQVAEGIFKKHPEWITDSIKITASEIKMQFD